jgi:hypothetical protein
LHVKKKPHKAKARLLTTFVAATLQWSLLFT